ncbi:MAG: hypothetical protein L7F78_05800 [Syntrophales bacterium LBB04]|nr:hypothetical protein [Syntrophales bacterium LBB04]
MSRKVKHKLCTILLVFGLILACSGANVSYAQYFTSASLSLYNSNIFSAYGIYNAMIGIYYEALGYDGSIYGYYAYSNLSTARSYSYSASTQAYYGYIYNPTSFNYYAYVYSYYDYYYKNVAGQYYSYGDIPSAILYVYYGDLYNGYAAYYTGVANKGGTK